MTLARFSKIKPLLVSYSDALGGAMEAARKSHLALRRKGVDSKLLVHTPREKTEALLRVPEHFKKTANAQSRWNYYPTRLFRSDPKRLFSAALVPSWVPQAAAEIPHDLIHLHWVQEGMLSLGDFTRFKKPLILSLHDSWAYTGGCHLPQDCQRWETGCGNCPILGLSFPWDLSHIIWKRKKKLWNNIQLSLVCPSDYMAQQTRLSPLLRQFPVHTLANPMRTDQYKPMSRAAARKKLKLPAKGLMLLAGAVNFEHDPNKGLDLLRQALKLARFKNKPLLLLSGVTTTVEKLNLPLNTINLGLISNEEMIHAYNAADVYVSPSRSENLPTMVMEAMSCGLPTVTFAIGSVDEMLAHKKTGWMASKYKPQDLAQGLLWALSPKGKLAGKLARKKVIQDFDSKKVASKTLDFYHSILREHKS